MAVRAEGAGRRPKGSRPSRSPQSLAAGMNAMESILGRDRPAAGDSVDSERWEAVRRRDVGSDGLFFYGVRTTGVYCRPHCASRMPGRANVVFFGSAEEAERAGYRACRRCRPGDVSYRGRHAEAVVRACRRIDGADGPVPLSELADGAGLSPSHFHRVFKKIVGVTPGEYAAALRARRLAERLRTGTTVTRAIYDAGFGSSSRVYGRAAGLLGMTPSRFMKGAHGLRIRHAVGRSSLGWVLAAATERGLCAVEFGESPEALIRRLRSLFPEAELVDDAPGFAAWVTRVVALVEDPGGRFHLPLDIRGTAFQRKVWNALRSIPPGETASYADVASRIGRPAAARAVGRACASNRIAVAVPCHRVVRRRGSAGGYRWGVVRKRALLAREAGSTKSARSPDRSRR